MPSQKTIKSQPFERGLLLDELGRFSFGPGVVGNAEMDAAGDGGMIVKEKDLDGIGVGSNHGGFAVVLEGLRARLAAVGNDAAVYFQAVDGRLILLIAAEGAPDSIRNETKKG